MSARGPLLTHDRAGALEHAQAWLRLQLAGGPRPATRLLELAPRDGISADSLRRAKRALNVKSRRASRLGPWSWALPAGESPACGDLQEKLLEFVLERAEASELPAAERERLRKAADQLARRQQIREAGDKRDRALFASDPGRVKKRGAKE
jgi:hypothetical protein